MITGTSHFTTLSKAMRYYATYCPENLRSYVDSKIEGKEIIIGAPEVKEGEFLWIDNDGRFLIGTLTI